VSHRLLSAALSNSRVNSGLIGLVSLFVCQAPLGFQIWDSIIRLDLAVGVCNRSKKLG
jgi:hypothetical protein